MFHPAPLSPLLVFSFSLNLYMSQPSEHPPLPSHICFSSTLWKFIYGLNWLLCSLPSPSEPLIFFYSLTKSSPYINAYLPTKSQGSGTFYCVTACYTVILCVGGQVQLWLLVWCWVGSAASWCSGAAQRVLFSSPKWFSDGSMWSLIWIAALHQWKDEKDLPSFYCLGKIRLT